MDITLAMAEHVNHGIVTNAPPPSSAVLGVIGSKRDASDLSLLQIQATTHALYQVLAPHISRASGETCPPTVIFNLKLWFPEPVVRMALPQMCDKFDKGMSATPRRRDSRKQCNEGVGNFLK